MKIAFFIWFFYICPIVTSFQIEQAERETRPKSRQKIQVISGPEYVQTAFPDPKNCKRFFICNGGVYHLQCPVGLLYNTDLTKCDVQAQGGRPGAKINPESDQDLSVFPDLFDKSRMFLCDGISRQYECSGNLYYNADYAKCDLVGSLLCRLRWNS
ncbi:unnamed protein product [Enterobius vermicularis]|uniref:Chitin-binding type-2 domain-containing protein n=1 Tax=Enterobius vermicularis TaxID=51028 RepID=A0A0N4VP20_ENTVE|nr:unnamed protein product [Enterobius vermicularis]